MKQKLILAMTGAIALACSIGLSSCSSSDEVADVNPTYNEQTNEVGVEFVLNVATAPNQFTRQSATTVQRASNFRGLQDAKLIGLSTGNSILAPFQGSSDGYEVRKTFELGTLYGSSAVSNTGTNNSENSSRRVLQLAMPINTDAMLVYARAIPSGDPEVDGMVNMNITEIPENSTIDLVSRLGDRVEEYKQTCNLGAAILNRILDANVSAVDAGDFTHNTYTNVGALEAITWKQLGTTYGEGTKLAPLLEILGKAYHTLIKVNNEELRAGSGDALFSIVSQLYSSATSVYGATSTNDPEANAQRLAIEIRNRIGNYFNTDGSNVTEWRSIGKVGETGTIINNLNNAGVGGNWNEVKTGDLKNLPTAFGLPAGAALLYLDNNGFYYKDPALSTSLLDQSKTTAPGKYMYPAELLYFNNSALRVSDDEKKVEDYPDGTTPWDTEGSWTGWSTGAVSSSTRSVAVKNNINYGVAMLQTKVMLEGISFSDNRNAIVSTQENQTLTTDDLKKLKLTGILIGGQPQQLGWNYLYKNVSGNSSDNVIFDNKIAGAGTVPTPAGEENYTLVFDNYSLGTAAGGTQDDQTNVLVALEFENQSKDFYGQGNMVAYGGKFYLTAKLTLTSATNYTDTETSFWPDNYDIPQSPIKRVFIQDFMTTATFKINETSLQKALVTVPDLRSSQTSLGLSVDLQWRPGLNFEAVLGQ